MIRVSGEVVEAGPLGTRVRVPASGCAGCKAHCSAHGKTGSFKELFLPQLVPEGSVTFSMSRRACGNLLLHSLGLPFAGFVIGASVAAGFGAGDVVALSAATAGLVAGVAMCRRQSKDIVDIAKDH